MYDITAGTKQSIQFHRPAKKNKMPRRMCMEKRATMEWTAKSEKGLEVERLTAEERDASEIVT